MIFDISGKRLVFGMEWKTFLGEGGVHPEARKTKSPFLWHADKAAYFGVLGQEDRKSKLKKPLYSGAIALMNRFPDDANLLFLLELPKGGFLICGIHQRRPKQGFDLVVPDHFKLMEMLGEFDGLCGEQGFQLYGNVIQVEGIVPATIEDVVKGADNTAQLRRVRSALVNPVVAIVSGVAIVAAGWYGVQTFIKYRAAETQRKAMAMQKGAQQLYLEELTQRRSDAALPAQSISHALAAVRGLPETVGGWLPRKAECNVVVQKQLACVFDFDAKEGSKATNKSFVDGARALAFDAIEFKQDKIVANKAYKLPALVDVGKSVDAGKPERDETIEFGSILQMYKRIGATTFTPFKPFAVPSGVAIAELTSPPIAEASWSWAAPMRAMRSLSDVPAYVTVNKVVVNFSDQPKYEIKQSLAMVTVSGKVLSKPN